MTDDRPDQQPGDDGEASAPLELVDWRGTAVRIRRSALVLGTLVVVGWLVGGLLGDGLTLRALGGWFGLGMTLLFVAEVVVVGGAALRGMLRAGEAGERLASDDVGLLPRFRRRG